MYMGLDCSRVRSACVFENPSTRVRCSLQVLVSEDPSTAETRASARAVTSSAAGKGDRKQLGEPLLITLPQSDPQYLDDFYRSFAEYKNTKGFFIVEGDHPTPAAPQSPTTSGEEADSAKKDVDIVTIAKCFRLPISAAARRLGVGETWLKQKCRQHNICRWPYRKVRSIEKVVEKLEAQLRDPAACNTANRVSAIKGQIEDLLKARDRICTGQVDEGSDDFDAIQATVAAGFGQFEESQDEDHSCGWSPKAHVSSPGDEHHHGEGFSEAVSGAMDCERPPMDELLAIPCHIEISTPPSARGLPLPSRFADSVVPQLQPWSQSSQQISLTSWSGACVKDASAAAATPPPKPSQKSHADAFLAVATPAPATPPRASSATQEQPSMPLAALTTPPRPSALAAAPPKLRALRVSGSPCSDRHVRSPLTSRLNLDFPASPARKGGLGMLDTPSFRSSSVCCNLFGSGGDDLPAFADDDFNFLLSDEPPIPLEGESCGTGSAMAPAWSCQRTMA